jgi:hypothetical protein
MLDIIEKEVREAKADNSRDSINVIASKGGD